MVPRPCRWTAPLVWHGLHYTALLGMDPYKGAPVRPYIPYYNRAAVLACTASGVAQAVYRRLVWLLYCLRWNRANRRKRACKALCAVLQRVWYNSAWTAQNVL